MAAPLTPARLEEMEARLAAEQQKRRERWPAPDLTVWVRILNSEPAETAKAAMQQHLAAHPQDREQATWLEWAWALGPPKFDNPPVEATPVVPVKTEDELPRRPRKVSNALTEPDLPPKPKRERGYDIITDEVIGGDSTGFSGRIDYPALGWI